MTGTLSAVKERSQVQKKRQSVIAQLLNDAVVRDGLADHSAEILGLEVGQVNECREVACGVSAPWLTLYLDHAH